MKPECPLAFVVLAWGMYIVVIPLLAVARLWVVLPVWIVLAPLMMWLYIRFFPSLAWYMGYGRVDDRPALVTPSHAQVTFYSALGCPFCPIVKKRLVHLKEAMGFELKEVDVTARPDILTRKGIWSVPVVEVDGRTVVGHATSEQLASFIAGRTPTSLPRSAAI